MKLALLDFRNGMHSRKQTFLTIFVLAAIILAVLPFVTTLNELMTRFVESTRLYRVIDKVIVPWEVKLIGVLLLPFSFEFVAVPGGMIINDVQIHLSWNCIGWQGMLLLIITFLGGFQGNYSRLSKIEAIIIGVLGTFLVNLLRMAITSLLAVFYGQLFAVLFHDYFAAFVFIVWLIVYWWFVYSFVLEQGETTDMTTNLGE
ncbi:exosortase/archaeosortase family protein [Patescibacteria group bacterium]|nr:exosortase/archaeosortase family protein [Patescibacteria group bacterium]MBU1868220.1 exosortase/archaeosortase family protein [Patescibacteria group bacterium]